jgi:glycerol-3-phosphate dehydrogenase
LARLPTIKEAGLRGGILYYDGQFDDARLLIALAQTAADHGATLLNYAPVVALIKNSNGLIHGVEARDLESGNAFHAQARIVINATGAFSDLVRRMSDSNAAPMLAPSQGVHLVFDRSFLPSESAILVPHAVDGRVLFAIPWAEHTLVGTTDTPVSEPTLEPRASEEEIDFILLMASLYLDRAPTRNDVLSVFAGIRPLARGADSADTALLSRDHKIHVESSGLLNITGGKWTTYRQMAEDCINKAIKQAGLRPGPCRTQNIRIHGFDNNSSRFGNLAGYGSDAEAIQKMIDENHESGEPLDPRLSYCEAEVVWAVRNEMARTVEDVLARRTRALFLNARAASDMAPRTAEIMARELQRPPEWRARQISEFQQLAKGYLLT